MDRPEASTNAVGRFDDIEIFSRIFVLSGDDTGWTSLID